MKQTGFEAILHGQELQKEIPERKIILSDVEEMLANKESYLGEGKAGLVHTLKGNPKCCMKVVLESRLDDMFGDRKPTINSIADEAQILETVWEHRQNVRIPMPYMTMELNDEDGKRVSLMLMERLNAVSLKMIHEDTAEIPKGFDGESFFGKLHNFLTYLHDELSIHHRDISESNILVTLDTAEPCLIDFGDSVRIRGDELPYTVRDDFGRVIRSYPNDLINLKDIKKRLLLKLKN